MQRKKMFFFGSHAKSCKVSTYKKSGSRNKLDWAAEKKSVIGLTLACENLIIDK